MSRWKQMCVPSLWMAVFLWGGGSPDSRAMAQSLIEPTPPTPSIPVNTLPPKLEPTPTFTWPAPEPVIITPIEAPIELVVLRSQRKVQVVRGTTVLATYRIAVGKAGWETPIGQFSVINREENPIFKSFKSGRIVQPGLENPLGVRWIGIWTDGKTQLGFHGTNEPELIGKAVSHGCMRMLNKDVTALYKYVSIGTLVTIKP